MKREQEEEVWSHHYVLIAAEKGSARVLPVIVVRALWPYCCVYGDWREREAGHNIYPLWEDETPQSQQSANNIHPPLVPFQYQKALSVSELKVQTTWKITTGTAGSVTHRGKSPTWDLFNINQEQNEIWNDVISCCTLWIFICLNWSRFLQSKVKDLSMSSSISHQILEL